MSVPMPPYGGSVVVSVADDDAGQRLNAVEHGPEEALLLRRGRVLAARQRHAGDENVLGIEAQIDVLQRDEAAHQQPGAGEQQQRQRDFDDDQGAPQPAATEAAADALARRPSAARPCRAGLSAAREPARTAASVSMADRQAEEQDRHIEADDGFARNEAVGNQSGHQALTPP